MRANIDLYLLADDPNAYAEEMVEWPDEAVSAAYGYDQQHGDVWPHDEGVSGLNPKSVAPFLVIAVIVCMMYLALNKPTAVSQSTAITQEISASAQTAPPTPVAPGVTGGDALAFVAPYSKYVITQGLHGYSYGHMAVDLAAGRGEPVLSPINGSVTSSYLDEWGNTTLIIENEVYTVTMLHGEYSVRVGDKVSAGQQVGTESNKGYTMDMAGNLCYNREWCGNHTHLNVYDKRLRSNVNPLDLIN
jgi:murein DD-endopeptidase MepM/ murein hydrolase activator NlpD